VGSAWIAFLRSHDEQILGMAPEQILGGEMTEITELINDHIAHLRFKLEHHESWLRTWSLNLIDNEGSRNWAKLCRWHIENETQICLDTMAQLMYWYDIKEYME